VSELAANGVSLGYGATEVLRRVDIAVPPGRFTALIGANGSGKSTLLHGLARLVEPSRGLVLLDGRDIRTLPTRDVARRLGVLPQRPEAPEGLTVGELVALGRYPHRSPLARWSDADAAAVAEAVATTGLTALEERALDSLSGGQRQRAWIAMALAQRTRILLLDEPTTFLDVAHQLEVMELLSELNRARGVTVVAAMHDLNQAARYADHLVALRDGRVVAEGAPRTLLTPELVAHVFGVAALFLTDPGSGAPVCVPQGRAEVRADTPTAPHTDQRISRPEDQT
jgi:iron complex transport system ATP-binding protein